MLGINLKAGKAEGVEKLKFRSREGQKSAGKPKNPKPAAQPAVMCVLKGICPSPTHLHVRAVLFFGGEEATALSPFPGHGVPVP